MTMWRTRKPNGYQSIHTVVLGPAGKTTEIQIRTGRCMRMRNSGVAAHWKYKEGTAGSGKTGSYENRIARLRKLIAWQEEMADSGEMLDEVRSQVFDDRVYVLPRKGMWWITGRLHAARFRLPYPQRCGSPLHRRENRRPYCTVQLPVADGRSD